MAKKNAFSSALVYSTDKDFQLVEEKKVSLVLLPGEQKLMVSIDNKHRGGKAVTIVDGYVGEDIEETGKQLKVFCGTGGSIKEGQIIIQGNNCEKIILWLQKKGFKNVKKKYLRILKKNNATYTSVSF